MSEPDLRILMVEDQEADAILIQRELRRQGMILTVRHAENEQAFVRALREFAPDLVLSDYSLPGFSGLEALAILRKERPDVPLIFVSGTVGEEQAVELLKLGATDYVLKDNLSRLPTAINRALREVKIAREGREAEKLYRAILEKMAGPSAPGQVGGAVPIGVAHELNNILAPIPMAVSMLRAGLSDVERDRMLNIIEGSAKRASGIVRGALIGGRNDDASQSPVAVDRVIKDVVQKLPQTWPETLRVKLHVEDDLWTVAGDAASIGQTILDLCITAGEAMPGGGELHLSVANRRVDAANRTSPPGVKPGAYVVVEISDTSEATRPDAAPEIGGPRGGRILTHRLPGERKIVHVYLPAVPVETPTASPAPTEAGKPLAGPGPCILLADDEETIRFAATAVLRKHGYRVLTATDGAEALRTFHAHAGEIALVLTDMVMPVMDGPALIRAIRQVDPAVRIIASSGQNEKTRLAELEAAGVNTVLDKPYAADNLLHSVREALGDAPGEP